MLYLVYLVCTYILMHIPSSVDRHVSSQGNTPIEIRSMYTWGSADIVILRKYSVHWQPFVGVAEGGTTETADYWRKRTRKLE